MRLVTPLEPPADLSRDQAILWLREHLAGMSLAERFGAIHQLGIYHGGESLSGPGSSLAETAAVREALPGLLRRHGITSLLDVPCGDHHWMSTLDLAGIDYVGADIVPELVAQNEARFAGRRFMVLDATRDPLPAVNLVFCRDLLIHLANADIARLLRNVAASGAGWLLTSHYASRGSNPEITSGDFRPVNLCAPPFSLPSPAETLVEHCTEAEGAFADKCLGLWPVGVIRDRMGDFA